jgi:hypothetical protein
VIGSQRLRLGPAGKAVRIASAAALFGVHVAGLGLITRRPSPPRGNVIARRADRTRQLEGDTRLVGLRRALVVTSTAMTMASPECASATWGHERAADNASTTKPRSFVGYVVDTPIRA